MYERFSFLHVGGGMGHGKTMSCIEILSNVTSVFSKLEKRETPIQPVLHKVSSLISVQVGAGEDG